MSTTRATVSLICILLCGSAATGQTPTAATVDLAAVFKSYGAFATRRAELQKEVDAVEAEMQGQRDEIMDLQTHLSDLQAGTAPYRAVETELNRLTEALGKRVQDSKQRLARIEAKAYYDVYVEVQRAVRTAADRKGISLVIRRVDPVPKMDPSIPDSVIKGLNHSMVYAASELTDITQEVLDLLNSGQDSDQNNVSSTASSVARTSNSSPRTSPPPQPRDKSKSQAQSEKPAESFECSVCDSGHIEGDHNLFYHVSLKKPPRGWKQVAFPETPMITNVPPDFEHVKSDRAEWGKDIFQTTHEYHSKKLDTTLSFRTIETSAVTQSYAIVKHFAENVAESETRVDGNGIYAEFINVEPSNPRKVLICKQKASQLFPQTTFLVGTCTFESSDGEQATPADQLRFNDLRIIMGLMRVENR